MRHRLYTGIAALAFLAAACQPEQLPQQPEVPSDKAEKVTFKATFEAVSTEAKATESNNGTFAWEIGDSAGVFTNIGINKFICTEAGATATFEGTLAAGEEMGNYAVYPYNEKHTSSGYNVDVYLPTEYTHSNSIYSPMRAYIEDTDNLKFNHLAGLLRITVNNLPATATKLIFKTSVGITGSFKVSSDQIAVATGTEDNTSVTINFEAAGEIRNGVDFYIPLPTGTYPEYSATLYDAANTPLAQYTSSTENTVTRAMLGMMEWDAAEEQEKMAFYMEVTETTANDILVNIISPEGLPLDSYGDPIQYIVKWAPAAEIGNLTDVELFARDLQQFAADYEQYADFEWFDYANAVQSYAIWYGDKENASLKTLKSQINCEIDSDTEYEIYIYAVEIDEENKTCYLLTDITRVRATTAKIEMVTMDFTFGIDRVSPGNPGENNAYFSVTPDNNEQTYIFYAVLESSIQYYVEEGAYTGEMTEDVAKVLLQSYIDSNNSSWWPTDPSEWTHTGFAYSGKYDGAPIGDTPEDNRYYIIASAIDSDFNICSTPKSQMIDITGLASTDDDMNFLVTDNGDGSYTYTTDPTGTALTNGHIVKVITKAEMHKYLEDNYYYDTEVSTYVEDIISKAVAQGKAEGLDTRAAVLEYLKSGDGASIGATTGTITPTEDTYIITYTVYGTSAAVNGLAYHLFDLPEEVVKSGNGENYTPVNWN